MHTLFHTFLNVWCLILYICMLYLLCMYSTRCSLVGANFSTETMCVCWLLFGRIISLVKNAQYASNQSKRGQPEKYQLILSRVCGAELDAKPWLCEDGLNMTDGPIMKKQIQFWSRFNSFAANVANWRHHSRLSTLQIGDLNTLELPPSTQLKITLFNDNL